MLLARQIVAPDRIGQYAVMKNTKIRRPASALLDKLLCPPDPGGPAAAA